MTARRSAALLRGGCVALATFGVAAQLELLARGRFGSWPLGLALLAGIGAAVAGRPGANPAAAAAPLPASRGRQGIAALLIALLLVAAASLVHGALATPSRHWDGAVAWETKARFLAHQPTLDQPFFAADAVYEPSPDYPLLQPLLLASVARASVGERAGQTADRAPGLAAGRLLFPAAWGLLLLAVYAGVRARGGRGDRLLPLAAAAAAGLVPRLVSPSLGAVDSGYADVLVAAAVGAVAAGALLRDHALLAAAGCVLVMAKPEGFAYGGLAVAAALSRPERARSAALITGCALGAGVALAVHDALLHPGRPPGFPALALAAAAAGAALLIGVDVVLARYARSPRRRALVVLAGGPLLALAVPLLARLLGDGSGTFGAYLGDAARPLQRLERLPAIVAGMADEAVSRGKFALTFVAAAVLPWLARRRGARLEAAFCGRFLALGLLTCVMPFLLSPEDDLRHHLRSSMARLLSHWIAPAWLLAGVAAARLLPASTAAGSQPRSAAHQAPTRSTTRSISSARSCGNTGNASDSAAARSATGKSPG